MIFQENGNKNKADMAIPVPGKTNFKPKRITRGKECHYIMIQGSTHQWDITTMNIYAPNIWAQKYIKQLITYLKGEIDKNIITVGEFNMPLLEMSRSSK